MRNLGKVLFIFFMLALLHSVLFRTVFLKWNSGLALLLSACFLGGFFSEKKFANKFTSALYRAGSIWFHLLLLALTISVPLRIIQVVFSLPDLTRLMVGAWLVLVLASLYYMFSWNVRDIEISSSKINKPVTIVQVSDIHAYGVNAKRWVSNVLKRAEKLSPDVIVFTGDIIDGPSIPPQDALAVTSKIPLLYILGNHEMYFMGMHDVFQGANLAQDRADKGDLRLLRNEKIAMKGIEFIAFDDTSDKTFLRDHLKPFVNTKKFSVLLFHEPIGVQDAAEYGVDLMLSGHTHAGQAFPSSVLVRMLYGKFMYGLHKVNDMWMYTTSGAGTHHWMFRLGRRNEVVRIKLIPQ